MSKLTFKRDPNSGYWAYGETYGYQIAKAQDLPGWIPAEGKGWILKVREVKETVGIRHTLGSEVLHCWTRRFDTLAEAKAVVQLFEDDPRHDLYAAQRTYHDTVVQPKIDAIVAEYDAMIAARKEG